MTTIPAETTKFLAGLLQKCGQSGFLTLTAIHPDGNRRTPSRHVAIHDQTAINDVLQKLFVANQMGWGAYVSIGLRQCNLGRWRRGGNVDVLALPALFADVDDRSETALNRIRNFNPPPSCITFTGGGFHVFWWLSDLLYDLKLAARLLRAIGKELGGDPMSNSQILRIPGSINTKSKRNGALCRIVEIHDWRYSPVEFPLPMRSPNRPSSTSIPKQRVSYRTDTGQKRLNPVLVQVVIDRLMQSYGGYYRHGSSPWIAARCPQFHERDRPGQHFSFNPSLGIGICLGKHGRMLLKDVCSHLNLMPKDYGGIYTWEGI
jgi:hypothetical protein